MVNKIPFQKEIEDYLIPLVFGASIVYFAIPYVTGKLSANVHTYNTSVNLTTHKHWQYIEQTPYAFTLYNGDSVIFNLSISSAYLIDVVEFRFYHICNNDNTLNTGRFYTYVNDSPALPTIGSHPSTPIYLALPPCPLIGTIDTTVWDTNDTRGTGYFKYEYRYEGTSPMTFKSIELYVVAQ